MKNIIGNHMYSGFQQVSNVQVYTHTPMKLFNHLNFTTTWRSHKVIKKIFKNLYNQECCLSVQRNRI